MRKLYRTNRGSHYTKTSIDGAVVTFQIAKEGVQWLKRAGIGVGDDLGIHYWTLNDQGWLSTGGSGVDHDGLEDFSPFVSNPSLTPFEVPSEVDEEEPITVRTHDPSPNAPLFLYSKPTSIYYTILSIDNSSDYYLEVPLLIRHRGAMELIEMDAEVGDEFTESGLRLIFERRWGYFDDERMPD